MFRLPRSFHFVRVPTESRAPFPFSGRFVEEEEEEERLFDIIIFWVCVCVLYRTVIMTRERSFWQDIYYGGTGKDSRRPAD